MKKEESVDILDEVKEVERAIRARTLLGTSYTTTSTAFPMNQSINDYQANNNTATYSKGVSSNLAYSVSGSNVSLYDTNRSVSVKL